MFFLNDFADAFDDLLMQSPVNIDQDSIQIDVPGAIPASITAKVTPFRVGDTRLEVGWKRAHKGKETPYKRTFHLSPKVDVKAITARLENGVLFLTLPEYAKAKTVNIPIQGQEPVPSLTQ